MADTVRSSVYCHQLKVVALHGKEVVLMGTVPQFCIENTSPGAASTLLIDCALAVLGLEHRVKCFKSTASFVHEHGYRK